MDKMGRLKGKSALVIGASTGIGAAVAKLMLAEGANVAVADLAVGGAGPDCLNTSSTNVLQMQCDVTEESSVADAIDKTVSSFGKMDILVNNAGVAGSGNTFVDVSWPEWHKIIDTNLQGVAHGLKQALPHMVGRKYGRIINTASQLAHKPAPRNAAYCAAKAAVVALTASVAQEVAEFGVTVNCVCPGPTDTPMWRASDEKWKAWKISNLPIKRIATPEEVAWSYIFLASDEASFMVGQSISPNGGDVMW
ncbi:SDR family NAD(P)-dependent oxidoreductase [Microvirga sp. M2]|uniref:SDR family NAD(P)-dependent oxidoreductase n=1 Tax=Microvirga sp. M2 TaxID=3073270 RepID=UPI0039C2A4DC